MATRLKSAKGRVAAELAVLIAVLAAAPLIIGGYDQQLLSEAFVFGVAAITLDIVWGYTGIPDLGHALWFGLGALGVGIATTSIGSTGLVQATQGGLGEYVLGTLLGLGLTLVGASAVGWFSFGGRLVSPFYVAIVTLALGTAATTIYPQLASITGGDNGLFGFGISNLSATSWYEIALAFVAAVAALAWIFVGSDYGLLLRAVRDNERRVLYLGYNVPRIKTTVFVLCAVVSALAGAVYGMLVGIVSSPLLGFAEATAMLVWVAVGGRGTILGPAVGAIAMSLVGSLLNQSMPTTWTLVEGALLVGVVVFIPAGVLPALLRPLRPFHKSSKARSVNVTDRAVAAIHRDGPALTADRLEFSYGSLRVLRGLHLEIRYGQLICVIGPNGAGKTTLTEVLSDGRLRCEGSVQLHGTGHGHRRSSPDVMARAGVVRKFQIPSLFPSLTVSETLLLAGRGGRRLSWWRRTRQVSVSPEAYDVLEASGLVGRENSLSGDLAHGLKQGLEIAMAVSAAPAVLLLDEPTAGLTAHERSVIGGTLRRVAASGVAVLVIEHDLDFVADIADVVAVMHNGQILHSGTAEQVSSSVLVRDAYLGVEHAT